MVLMVGIPTYKLPCHSPHASTEDADFGGKSGTITFVPGEDIDQSITIQINDDKDVESNEPLVIGFSSSEIPPEMQNFPTPSITIIDNDICESNPKYAPYNCLHNLCSCWF